MQIEEKQWKRAQIKEKFKYAVKEHEHLSKENDLIAERFEMLVEKLKKKMIKNILIFQNEEQLEVKETRKDVDIECFWICVQKN